MGREIFPAMSGGLRAMRELEAVSNNLATVNTTGYKAARLIFKLHAPEAAKGLEKDSSASRLAHAWSALDSEAIDFRQGSLRETGSLTHLALDGQGFFRVENVEGGPDLLTRDGSFELDADGFLVTSGGRRVLDDTAKPISVGAGQLEILTSGEVRVDAEKVATLASVDVQDRTTLS